MDAEKIAQDQWKAARDSGATATKIAIVLFAALIISWMGMWSNVNKYRAAVASRLRLERKSEASGVSPSILGPAVRGLLTVRAQKEPNKEKLKQTIEFANQVAKDPNAILRTLSESDWRRSMLSDAITNVSHALGVERQHAVGRFQVRRASAEKTPFKLLGLDFTVDGFWAWIVWLLFFSGGVLYLWTARLGLIRRCGHVWKLLHTDSKVTEEDTRKLADSLPIWIRPLPGSEPWTAVLTNGATADLILEPLSILCVALGFVCLGLSVPVVRLALVSTSLLETGGPLGLEPIIHGFTLCLLAGLTFGTLLIWIGTPTVQVLAERLSRNRGQHDFVELESRRAWIAALVAACGTAFFLLPRCTQELYVRW